MYPRPSSWLFSTRGEAFEQLRSGQDVRAQYIMSLVPADLQDNFRELFMDGDSDDSDFEGFLPLGSDDDDVDDFVLADLQFLRRPREIDSDEEFVLADYVPLAPAAEDDPDLGHVLEDLVPVCPPVAGRNQPAGLAAGARPTRELNWQQGDLNFAPIPFSDTPGLTEGIDFS